MKRKTMIFLTSLLIFIPMIVGLLFWNQLPEELPIHINSAGEVDNWGTRKFVVFLLPLFFLAVHLLCSFITLHDPKKQNISDKIFLLVLTLVPATSLISCLITYSAVLGINLSMNLLLHLFLGIVFIGIGNYLPKSRQNYTVGIRLPWTLSDSENWNKTHRFAGALWVICGMISLANLLINSRLIPTILIFTSVLLPTIYSFILYKKKGE